MNSISVFVFPKVIDKLSNVFVKLVIREITLKGNPVPKEVLKKDITWKIMLLYGGRHLHVFCSSGGDGA